MRLVDIEARNAGALEVIQQHPEGIDSIDYPDLGFFGYYEADIFECPTFLMFTNNDCPRGWDILFSRSFEPQSMKLWCRLARTATGIVDIGAHVGTYSLAAAALRNDIKIHAFEPNPYGFSRLRMHKIINAFDQIEEYTVAVASKNGLKQFNWVKKGSLQISSGGTLARRTETEGIERIVVPMINLDERGLAQSLGARPLVKIDVEGTEADVFGGIQDILALKPDIILETFLQEACDTINEMIKPLGYSVYHVLEKTRRIERREHLMPCQVDADANFNQLLTIRTPQEVAALAAE